METIYSKRRRLPNFDKPWPIYYVTIATRSRRQLSPEARTAVLDPIRHFHGRYVRGDHDLREKFNYIVDNPWRANLIAPNAEYPWVWTPDFDASRAAPDVPGGTPALPGSLRPAPHGETAV